MSFAIRRTLPPAAAPIPMKNIVSGVIGMFRGSKAVADFEQELRHFYGVRHCRAVSSGKAALTLLLEALHQLNPERDEVLIPAYTCYSVPSAIVRAGLKVRLCDLAPDSLDLDFRQLGVLLDNPRILCVVPTHLYGMPSDVKRIRSMAGNRGVYVVEDAAQAMGGEWNGSRQGTLGDAAIFSLGRGKAFSTVDGGIILTNSHVIGNAVNRKVDAIAGGTVLDQLKKILFAVAISLLIHPILYWLPKSLPFLKLGETHFDPEFSMKKFTPFQAGLASDWWENLWKSQKARGKNAARYAGRYGILLSEACSSVPDLIRFPVLTKNREAKLRLLGNRELQSLGVADAYPDSIDGIVGLDTGGVAGRFPEAKKVADRLLTLPVHCFVREDDQSRIAGVIGNEIKPVEIGKQRHHQKSAHRAYVIKFNNSPFFNTFKKLLKP